MPSRRDTWSVAVVAADAGDREELVRALGAGFSVRAAPAEALREGGALVDPVVLVGVVRAADAANVEEALQALRTATAAHALVLLGGPTAESELQRLLERLEPVAWLPHPAPLGPLRRAVRLALAGLPPGEGARREHRRAPVLLGTSAAIRTVIEQIRHIAPAELPVLVLGETGTGKELVARAIHEQSRRAAGPFVAVNCSAFPDTLLESELFGFVRGAFTGADRARSGLFEQAHGGTLFLDEIGDTSPAMQAKLLRVLQEKRMRPLGGDRERVVDVRVVSATHSDLEEAAARGAFRPDLFYRLNAATIQVPPLRRRRVDIPFLAQHFAEELGEAHARRITLGEDFVEALTRYGFPGNVRELRNAVERAIALTRPGEDVSAAHLHLGRAEPELERSVAAQSGTLRARVEHLELAVIREALQRFGGNRTRVAEALGLSRLGLRQKMRRLGLETGAG
jgi:transcriptional regulator with PAS, ATPase and Fis domain